jgi:hypothetical protein
MTVALLILMLLSGAGAFGFFQDAFNHSMLKFENASAVSVGTQAQIDDAGSRAQDDGAAVTEAQSEIAGLRKQVDALPADYARSRTLAANRIEPEIEKLNAKIDAATKDKAAALAERKTLIAGMAAAQINEDKAKLDAGPFMAVANKIGCRVDTLATIFISLLVTVFDPLAVSLIGAFAMTGKMLKDERKAKYAAIAKRRYMARSRKVVAPAPVVPVTPKVAPTVNVAKPVPVTVAPVKAGRRRALGRGLAEISRAKFNLL